MKKRIIVIFLATLIAGGCKKLKKPAVCIEGPQETEVNQEVTYTICGEQPDKAEWWSSSGASVTGNSFKVTFPYRGGHTVSLKAKRKLSGWTEQMLHVNVGSKSNTWIYLYNICLPGGSTIANNSEVQYYRGYIYESRSDWAADAAENSHARCLDSARGAYSNEYKSAGILFTGVYPAGEKYVAVEYRSPNFPSNLSSNWYEVIMPGSSGGVVNISNTAFQDNSGAAQVDDVTRRIITGKWTLANISIDGISSNLQECSKDDYIKFYPNLTWTYHTGPDNCNGGSLPSHGSFNFFGRYCINNLSSITMTTYDGPFTGFSGANFENQLSTMKIHSSANGSVVTFEFLWKNN